MLLLLLLAVPSVSTIERFHCTYSRLDFVSALPKSNLVVFVQVSMLTKFMHKLEAFKGVHVPCAMLDMEVFFYFTVQR